METELAIRHQIHGVQPVLPVPEVAAAVQWFCRVLGFQLDFQIGEPADYARVRLGDRSFGDPVYIHLRQQAAGDAAPTGETRLHAGHDIEGLHRHAVAAGAEVMQAPADQPWGLREFMLRAPGGHRLIIGAELAAGAPADGRPRTVINAYRAKPGQHAALLDEVRRHVPALQSLGLATVRAPFLMQGSDGVLVEVFEWASAAAMARAHDEPEVLALWDQIRALCSIERLNTLPQTAQLFAEFDAL